MCVGGSVTTITRNCVHQSSPNWVCRYLQLIKFWPSRAPGKGVCIGAKNFGSALLQPARSVFVSSERFFQLLFYFPHLESLQAKLEYPKEKLWD